TGGGRHESSDDEPAKAMSQSGTHDRSSLPCLGACGGISFMPPVYTTASVTVHLRAVAVVYTGGGDGFPPQAPSGRLVVSRPGHRAPGTKFAHCNLREEEFCV